MTTHTPKEIQTELIRLGFNVGPDGADGDFGANSWKGLNEYLKSIGRTPIPETLQDASHLVMVLPLIFHPKENNVDTTKNEWLSGIVTSTIGKYIIGIIAGWLAKKWGFDPTEGAATVQGVLAALISLASLAWGAYESSKSKVVVAGVRVPLKDMPLQDQQTIASIASKNAK